MDGFYNKEHLQAEAGEYPEAKEVSHEKE